MIAETVKVMYRMFLIENGFVTDQELNFNEHSLEQKITIMSGKRNLKTTFNVYNSAGTMTCRTDQWRDHQKVHTIGSGEVAEFLPGGIQSWPIW